MPCRDAEIFKKYFCTHPHGPHVSILVQKSIAAGCQASVRYTFPGVSSHVSTPPCVLLLVHPPANDVCSWAYLSHLQECLPCAPELQAQTACPARTVEKWMNQSRKVAEDCQRAKLQTVSEREGKCNVRPGSPELTPKY